MSESFYLTNICPQTPSLNQGDWNRLEGKIRDWARRDSAVVIVCGPLVSVDDTTIGPNKVKVPRAFYKVVYRLTSTRLRVSGLFLKIRLNVGVCLLQIMSFPSIAWKSLPELIFSRLFPMILKTL